MGGPRSVGATPYLEMISGIKLFRDAGGQVSISFCEEDRDHPDLLRRSRQACLRGEARRSLEWATLAGKDALLWQTFRPLELGRVRLAHFLQAALDSPAAGFELDQVAALDAAQFTYWWRPRNPFRDAGARSLHAPEAVEIDLRIQVGRRALLFIQAFEEGEWESYPGDFYPDPLLHALDFGTTEARAHGIAEFYLIVLTPCRDPLHAYSARIGQYRDHPDTLRVALAHRSDLSLQDFGLLAGRIGWSTWREAEAWTR